MKKWTQATVIILSLLCLMSLLDDSYEVKVIANQDLIDAQHAARMEAAARKVEHDYLMAKANWMTNGRGMK